MRARTATTLGVLLSLACISAQPALVEAQDGEHTPQSEPCAAPLGGLRVEGELRRVVHAIWHRSPTVRRQLARIASERTLVVTFGYCRTACPHGVAALTHLTIEDGSVRRADVEISVVGRAATAELVGHELEHILEQLDGVDLRKLSASRGASGHGVRSQHDRHYETERARHVGLAAAAEYEAHARPPLTCRVHP